MIEGILELLVNVGIISADWYHDRKIRKRDKKDIKRIGTEGEIYPGEYSPDKRNDVKKSMFRPSVIVYGIVLGCVLAFTFVYTFYQNSVSKPSETITEIELIQKSAENWKERKGSYPESIKPLTYNRPHRNTWLIDEWGVEYNVVTNADKFEVVSAGPDKRHGTYDDISIQSESQP